MSNNKIAFNMPYLTGNELPYINAVNDSRGLSGDGQFTKKCHTWIEEQSKCAKALLTHSCTAALEMAGMLIDLKPGDEVIMPSYTFSSTANAFVLRGAVPVFVDIREDTINLNENLIEAAITKKTKAIVPVHYAGVSCEMDAINDIAEKYQLKVIEDAAQGVMAFYKGRALGNLGDFGAYSFHATKNVISGEGGCLLIKDGSYATMAEIIREKGTNRSQFLRGDVDKYTWQEVGSSYLPSELIAAFLWAQLEKAEEITTLRLGHWDYYYSQLADLEAKGYLQRPTVPDGCQHNAHMFYILLPDGLTYHYINEALRKNNIFAVSHYVPLHSSPAGLKYGRYVGDLAVTDTIAERLIRLPLSTVMTRAEQDKVLEILHASLMSAENPSVKTHVFG
jgi:dTDP-4-amino-4,6-dideoxygalactose transaminase